MRIRENAIKYIEIVIQSNFTNPTFGVNQLADKIGISISYLREITWNKYDMSPRLLIETIRLEAATNLMLMDHLNFYQICKHTGFNHPKTFRRTFQRRLGLAPSECKKNLEIYKYPVNKIDHIKKILWCNNGEKVRQL